MKHTPEPWEVVMPTPDTVKESAGRISIRAAGVHVATIHTGGMEYQPSSAAIANGVLMAAAPDLLAACKAALDALNDPDMDCYHDAEALETKLESAIERATGKGAS